MIRIRPLFQRMGSGSTMSTVPEKKRELGNSPTTRTMEDVRSSSGDSQQRQDRTRIPPSPASSSSSLLSVASSVKPQTPKHVCFPNDDKDLTTSYSADPTPITEQEFSSYYYTVRGFRSQPNHLYTYIYEIRIPHSIFSMLYAMLFVSQKDDMDRFDKDRAVTAFIYMRRRDCGVAWDDDKVDSIRGLEDVIAQSCNGMAFSHQRCNNNNYNNSTNKDTTAPAPTTTYVRPKCLDRLEHMKLVIAEYKRLHKDVACEESLARVAAKSSESARQQARQLGKDDALAVGSNYKAPPTTRLLKRLGSRLTTLGWVRQESR